MCPGPHLVIRLTPDQPKKPARINKSGKTRNRNGARARDDEALEKPPHRVASTVPGSQGLIVPRRLPSRTPAVALTSSSNSADDEYDSDTTSEAQSNTEEPKPSFPSTIVKGRKVSTHSSAAITKGQPLPQWVVPSVSPFAPSRPPSPPAPVLADPVVLAECLAAGLSDLEFRREFSKTLMQHGIFIVYKL